MKQWATKSFKNNSFSLNSIPIFLRKPYEVYLETLKRNLNKEYKVLEIAWTVYERSKKSIPTNKLNVLIEKVMNENPPPAEKGKVIKINYSVQVHKQPAVIALFANYPRLIKISYQRYLMNQIRSHFNLKGIPIRLSFRKK